MPRNVRNFWIDLQVDGRQAAVETGPRSPDGGFRMTIYIRKLGRVETALRIVGRPTGDGGLRLGVYDEKSYLHEIEVER